MAHRPTQKASGFAELLGVCVLAAGLALAPSAAPAQQPSAPATPNAPAESQPPRKPAGFFDNLGEWMKKSADDFDAGLKKMKDSIEEFNARADKNAKDAAAATKEATEALVKLPTTRVVEGREACSPAPNGSPDCKTAAESICKAKGFSGGNSIDTQSAQKCPARVWLSGRKPAEGDCSVETFVTRAACQ